MLCGPAARAGVEKVAMPPLSGPVPMLLFASRNATLPVASTGATVAVNVTDCPADDGSTLEVNHVLVPPGSTVCVGKDPVLPAKLVFPLKTAVMLCCPTVKDEVLNVADPLFTTAGVPRFVLPSLNCTLPPAVPAPGATAETAAVKT